MTTAHLVWLLAQALATIVILVVGTLAAAELLPHQRRRGREGGERRDDQSRGAAEQDVAPDSRSGPAASRVADALAAFAPLGSSLYAGSQLSVTAADRSAHDSEDRSPVRAIRSFQ
jgi:hypothetical protein